MLKIQNTTLFKWLYKPWQTNFVGEVGSSLKKSLSLIPFFCNFSSEYFHWQCPFIRQLQRMFLNDLKGHLKISTEMFFRYWSKPHITNLFADEVGIKSPIIFIIYFDDQVLYLSTCLIDKKIWYHIIYLLMT